MILKLTGKKEEILNVTTFYFKPDQELTWKAGQYMRYHLEDPNPDERKVDRYFTIASAPHEGYIQLTTRFVPDDGSTFKKDLRYLKIGDTIDAAGPMGSFVIDDPDLNYVFIAGGIGITPYRAILKDLDFKNLPINITLFYANRDNNIVFKEELEEITRKHTELKIKYIFEPNRINEQLIREGVTDLLKPYFYLSGPQPMVEAFVPMLEGMGVEKAKIKTDFFPGYKGI